MTRVNMVTVCRNGSISGDSVPVWSEARGCGRKAFWRGCDEGDHGNRLPQRQCFPRFGAGVERGCGRKSMFWEVRPQLSFFVIPHNL